MLLFRPRHCPREHPDIELHKFSPEVPPKPPVSGGSGACLESDGRPADLGGTYGFPRQLTAWSETIGCGHAAKLAFLAAKRYLASVSDDRRLRSPARRAVALGVACACLAGCVVWAVLVAPSDQLNGLSAVLAVAAVAAGVGVAHVRSSGSTFSASFLVYILAGAFLGPASGFVAAVITEVIASAIRRTRYQAFVFNALAAGLTALLAGTLVRALVPHDHSTTFYLVLARSRRRCSR